MAVSHPVGSRDYWSSLRFDIGEKQRVEFNGLIQRWWNAMYQRWKYTRDRAQANAILISDVDLTFDSVVVRFVCTGEVRCFVGGKESNDGIVGLLATPGFEWKHLGKMREDIARLIDTLWTKTTDEMVFRRQYLATPDRDVKFIEDMAEWEIIKD